MKSVYFITGIDTNIGKSYATGFLAKSFGLQGFNVITQKIVQTGCTGISEDILLHRQMQGVEIQKVDQERITCSYLFSYPCSPHLAAKMENSLIDMDIVTKNTRKLQQQYDIVLIEGAGGLLVPIDEEHTTADYIATQQLPVILVTSGRLGSINHTLLSLEVCRKRAIAVEMLVYNTYFDNDKIIVPETQKYLQKYLSKFHEDCQWIELPEMK